MRRKEEIMLTLPGYELEEDIYQGHTTVVYRGYRSSDRLPVTLKTQRAEYPTLAEEARFRREYEIGRQVDSPGVIKHYGLEQHQHRLFLVREDFGALGLRAVMQPGGVELPLFLEVALQLAAALGDIHQQRIIHKDIKTGNILINPETRVVKVIDFGIATQLSRERQQFLNPNRLEGTLSYISPEQTGRMNRAIDYRSDFYSLGVTLYELLCGRLPFESQDAMELVHSHIARTAPPPGQIREDVPQAVSEIVVKLMAKNARERYQSARGLQADLENARRQWREQGRVRPFALGQQDVTERFQIPQKLYGRRSETARLLEGFERVVEGGREMLLVTGYAGIGKSVLVHELHKPITERRGYFISGKYDRLQRNIPYNAIVRAFEKLVQQLLTEDEAQLERWKENLLRALGPNGQVIIDVIPQVELIVGQQPAVAKSGPTEAQNRFNLVFQNFMRVFCRPEHPLVVFLDDLQWVDAASLNLIQGMLMDTETRHLFLIGAYRDNEVDASHPLMMTLETLRERGVPLGEVTLAPLSLGHVTRLVAETLYDVPDRVKPLAELVHHKTNGNPFFTNQFLTRLYEDGLLTFVYPEKGNGKRAGWRWDLSAIQAQSITDNVVELMLQKLQRLPAQTQACLRLAACIGNQFDLAVLSVIFERDAAETLAALWQAVQEDLVMPLDENYKLPGAEAETHFAFLHGRVQQAAYALIDDAEKRAVHLQVGRLLLSSLSEAQRGEHIFDIVNHLNLGARLITRVAEREELARLNLQAGKKTKSATAYGAAAQYLARGLELLPGDSWEKHHALAFELHKESAECEYLMGHFERSAELLDEAFERCVTDLERGQLYLIRLTQQAAQAKYVQVVHLGIQALRMFGVDLPAVESHDEINETFGQELAWYQQRWAGKAISELGTLPINNDPQQNMVMTIFAAILDCAMSCAPHYAGTLTISMVNYSIKHGNTQMSPFGYIWHAVVLLTGFQDYEGAYQFGKLALQLNEEKIHNTNITCKLQLMFAASINHLKNHLKAKPGLAVKSYQAGLESGDLIYAAYGVAHKIMGDISAGLNLSDVIASSERELAIIKRLNIKHVYDLSQLSRSFALNLRGETETLDSLNYTHFQESEFRQAYSGLEYYMAMLGHRKLMSHYLFENYSHALQVLLGIDLTGIDAQVDGEEIRFYAALTLLKLYSQASEKDRQEYDEIITQYHTVITKLADSCPDNFGAHDLLVSAERARVAGRELEAMDFYDQAIESARESELIHNEALANELAAKFWLARGKERIARLYMTEASHLYARWGATAKVRDLEQKYPRLLAWPTTPAEITLAQTIMTTATPGTDTDTASLLDLSSVVKASQAISSEIELDRLLTNLLDIVLENAGAQRGCLVLEKEGQLLIEAQGEVGGQVQVLQSLPIEVEGEPLLLAPEIIRYVARTHESVVLDDASQQGAFTSSPYVMERRIKSVLCAPLISRGALLGLIYLENNLATSAFTPERVELLRLLGTQASISITNAQAMRLRLLNAQLEAENARMEAELGITRRLQLMLLPGAGELAQIEGLDIAGFMEPAEEVGGDYYDVLQRNGQLKIGIGDVTGHGLESGVVMLMLQTAVRTLLTSGERDPVRFMDVLNQTLHANMQRMDVDKSLTLALLDYAGSYADGTGKLRLSGQHEQLIVVRQGGQVELVDTLDLGLPVGLVEGIADFVGELCVELGPSDGVVLYSDGFTEAQNEAGEFYGLERLCAVVSQHWAESAEEIKEAVVRDARGFIGGQTVYDDLTLLVVKQK
jgi:predicted ATPase/serine phosphatase RsbU (regulator of sigma subunit)/tRNA A-37 threonylcarbamoyl transferase component Bud32